MAKQTHASIPSKLRIAKQAALKSFFVSRQPEALMALAARTEPRHNVVGVGIGYKMVEGKVTSRRCVRFYVEKKLPKEAIPRAFLLPKKIRGVGTDVVETGRFRAFAGLKERQFMRPAHPGCSVGFAFTGAKAGYVMAGTFGAVVESAGKRFILSNNHVLANENALKAGAPIFQPGLLDSGTKNQIAKLSKFVKLKAKGFNTVDCAIAEVLKPNLIDPAVLPKVGALKSGAPVTAAEGMAVEKDGRTTGYTQGKITDVNATVKIDYDLGTLTFEDQIVIIGNNGGAFSDAGDSGSLIVDCKTKQPVGLLFAGSKSDTIANHIGDVLSELKVSIVAKTSNQRATRAPRRKRPRVRKARASRER
ncbi:MAG: hypothetical protein WAW96_15130 [Alphaproteobacteria bacterium]